MKDEITFNKSSCQDIEKHLVRCDIYFRPNLSTYINIPIYSKKLERNSTRFEIWSNLELVGLLAAYFNEETKYIFISNLSVLYNFQKRNVAKRLILQLINTAKRKNYSLIKLEVYNENKKAKLFYHKMGFVLNHKIDKLKTEYVFYIK